VGLEVGLDVGVRVRVAEGVAEEVLVAVGVTVAVGDKVGVSVLVTPNDTLDQASKTMARATAVLFGDHFLFIRFHTETYTLRKP
jgi:hypothetical protein